MTMQQPFESFTSNKPLNILYDEETGPFHAAREEGHNPLFADPVLIKPTSCPATCELCGEWMPKHSNGCPRNGVHPSEWTL
ncbi:hypothetical protein BC937DRAFT_90284 [Endogone sp. FLAS-F59071]|nr:hypothetical protein BC937DRAFT_90284 [Endogone sp. FLAS-F59071]|eukprot:RUS22123.1 hypothetical protein BC937DRAFT_90284 [Endogone sp. FLAS-F59071]